MINLKNISKTIASKEILKNISVEFGANKLTSLIGANGAGKSTLLGIASRLNKSDTGEIFFNGVEFSKFKDNELAKKISILKQINQVNIRLKTRDLVAFGRFPHSGGRLCKTDHEKIDEALDFMELGGFADRFIDTLSGGQRQRAFIAMIIAQDTEFIMLDEPLNNLDMKHSQAIMQILRLLVEKRGKSVVVVLHDINFASFYSDEIIAMKNGEILCQGGAGEIIKPEVLRQIYDMEIKVENYENKNLCVYF